VRKEKSKERDIVNRERMLDGVKVRKVECRKERN